MVELRDELGNAFRFNPEYFSGTDDGFLFVVFKLSGHI
jgi:hypothetical protein